LLLNKRFEWELTTFLPLAVVLGFFTFDAAPLVLTTVCCGCLAVVVLVVVVLTTVVVVFVVGLPPDVAVLADGVDMIRVLFL
jgi:hypothetical protein